MASKVPVTPGTDDYNLVLDLSAKVRSYVVTWLGASNVRRIFGFYRNASTAFRACKEARARNIAAAAVCILVVGTAAYWVDNGGPFHH
jgi:hypothetical protein